MKHFKLLLIQFLIVALALPAQAATPLCEMFFSGADAKVSWLEDLIKEETGHAFDLQENLIEGKRRAKLSKKIRDEEFAKLTTNQILNIARRFVATKDPYYSQMGLVLRGQISEARQRLIDTRIQRHIVTEGLLSAFARLGIRQDRGFRDRYKLVLRKALPKVGFAFNTAALAFTMGQAVYLQKLPSGALIPATKFVRFEKLPEALRRAIVERPLEESVPQIIAALNIKTNVDFFTHLLSGTLARVMMVTIVAVLLEQELDKYGYGFDDIRDQLFYRKQLEEAAFESCKADAAEAGFEVDEVELKARISEMSVQQLRDSAQTEFSKTNNEE